MPLKLQLLVSSFSCIKLGWLSKHLLFPSYRFLFLKLCFIKSVFLVSLSKEVMMIKHFILKHDQIEMCV